MTSSQEQWELPGELVHGCNKPATDTAKVAYSKVLKYAGASKSRDACDQRIISDVKKGTVISLIHRMKLVGGQA